MSSGRRRDRRDLHWAPPSDDEERLRKASLVIEGTISRKSSIRLPQIKGPVSTETPVMLPPGWARLSTRPCPTRSDESTTVGIVPVMR